MFNVVVVAMIVASILMVFAVLAQRSKGGGLNQNFASQTQLMGVRKSTDFIEKATWGLAIALLVFSLASVAFIPTREMATESDVDQLIENSRGMGQATQQFDAQPAATEAPVAETPAAE